MPPRQRTLSDNLREAGRQVAAGVNGAGDALTMGLGDKYVAWRLAGMGIGRGANIFDRYTSIRAAQEARDHYDAEHYGAARRIGGAVGVAGSIAVTGGFGAGAGAARIAPHVPRLVGAGVRGAARRLAPQVAAATGGAISSVAGQSASDAATRRVSSPQAYVASAAGGGAGGVAALHGGPRSAAATESIIDEVVHSALTAEPISVEDIERGMVGGVYAGRLGEVEGIARADALPSGFNKHDKGLTKEKLGEFLSDTKTRLYGLDRPKKQVYRPVSGGKTKVDQETSLGELVEVKFGNRARLSTRQKEAVKELPDYTVDHWLPRDIGQALGGFFALIGGQAPSSEDSTR